MVEGENEDKDAHSASEAENQFLIFQFVITDIDFSNNPVLKINVDSVDNEASWKLGIDNLSWSDFKPVINSSTSAGEFTAQLNQTGYTGKQSVNLILIIEGNDKFFTVSSIELLN